MNGTGHSGDDITAPPLVFWSPTVGVVWQDGGTFVQADGDEVIEFGFTQPADAVELIAATAVPAAPDAATELRRMAEGFESIAKGSHGWVIRADAAALRARADELVAARSVSDISDTDLDGPARDEPQDSDNDECMCSHLRREHYGRVGDCRRICDCDGFELGRRIAARHDGPARDEPQDGGDR